MQVEMLMMVVLFATIDNNSEIMQLQMRMYTVQYAWLRI